ncbi:MAG: DNA cytosine methyltransferase [Microcoleus anatoxicus]|uniref:DNA cytosine methyltransferase n=1 Tax=Microcoleus anatoxicus TaxID=2705319 RepID=UPI003673411F
MNPTMYAQQLKLFELFNSNPIKTARSQLTFVDLFAGIGGFRIPLEELGCKCLGYSEINKKAIQVYQDNFIKID